MKFRVESPEHSEKIQRELFRLGFGWLTEIKVFKNTDKSYLIAEYDDMTITYANRSFEQIDAIETTLEELKNMK